MLSRSPECFLEQILSLCIFKMFQSPAVDVVGVGTATGRIIIHNIRLDETLMSFKQDWGPISSLAFRTGTGGRRCLSLSLSPTDMRCQCLSLSIRWSSYCGVWQSSGSHRFLGSGTPSDCHTAETCPQHSCCRGNLSARRAAADHNWSRQRHQSKSPVIHLIKTFLTHSVSALLFPQFCFSRMFQLFLIIACLPC